MSKQMGHFKSFTARKIIDHLEARGERGLLQQLTRKKANHKFGPQCGRRAFPRRAWQRDMKVYPPSPKAFFNLVIARSQSFSTLSTVLSMRAATSGNVSDSRCRSTITVW
jgi:hypothetical protein